MFTQVSIAQSILNYIKSCSMQLSSYTLQLGQFNIINNKVYDKTRP